MLNKSLFAFTLAASLAAAPSLAQAAVPTHVYLMDDATDQLGGPSLVTLGGSFSAGDYVFAANEGFSVSGAVASTVYTLDFAVSLDALSGYRRLVEFKDLTADVGVYSLNAALNFYPEVTGPSVFAANQLAQVTLTRDAAGLFTGYVNGVQQIQFNDAAGLATFTGPGQIAWFLRDDNAIGGEASAGRIDYLRIYDTALSASEVASLASPVPEPAAGALVLGGLLALAAWRRRAGRSV